MDLVGASEIADLLGVTRQQVHRLAAQRTFPKPVAELRQGKIWRRRDVERWAEKRRGPGRPEKPWPTR